jgi:FAD dependent oxidoreductase
MAPYISGRRILLLTRHRPTSASVDGDHVRAVHVRNLDNRRDLTLLAPYFLDATELGELLPLTKTEYVVGAEPQRDTGEPHALSEANPANQQAFSCCFPMDFVSGEDHTIDRPAEYDFWQAYVPAMKPAWPGRLLSWQMSDPISLRERKVSFDPTGPGTGGMNLWLYRRLADQKNFQPGTYSGDLSLVNWPQNDYLLGNLIDVAPEEASKHLQRAKQLSLSLLYWMQTEAPRPDGGTGYKGLRLREDVVGTTDGLAKYPYIRESRRIKAEFTVLEQHVGTDARMQSTGQKREEVNAMRFADTVGIGSYRIDLHPSTAGNNYIDVSSLPFQIPLGALIPRRMENLLPACKNLGVTHITNGCYRLHPVEWNIGEAVGALTAFCLQNRKAPRQVLKTKTLLADFQAQLQRNGVELEWRRATPR